MLSGNPVIASRRPKTAQQSFDTNGSAPFGSAQGRLKTEVVL